SPANYEALVAALPSSLKIASVGAADGAHKIKRTTDLRGIPLEKFAAYCGAAKLVIGPSSGPIHFAMHCGTSALTWIGADERCNYYPQWNPFHVPLCCLPGWQPSPEVVLHKLHEMLLIKQSLLYPVEYIVFGTKRSGHHALIEWFTRLEPNAHYVHWNDCIKSGIMTPPWKDFANPTAFSFPKELNRNFAEPCVNQWNRTARNDGRILSYEGIRIQDVVNIPEASHAKLLVFVLRDAVNLASSAKKGLPWMRDKSFLSAEFHELLSTYRGYLSEATGRTNHLGALREKTVFISYNRWHSDPEYRTELIARIGKRIEDPGRGKLAVSKAGSGFDKQGTDAAELTTLERWPHFMRDANLWNVTADTSTYEAEMLFHGGKIPLGIEIPVKTHVISSGTETHH
ncbi:MAG: hypothetical protein ABIP85_12670, partial [Chthoniobacteraceae bacterium]